MDPLTHSVLGMAIAKVAGHPLTASDPVTVGLWAGSVLPDIDIVARSFGDYFYLKHHRGASHSLPGALVLSCAAALLLSFFFGISAFPVLLLSVMGGAAGHLAVDLFNPYGAKLLWPFLDKRFATGLMISFDPVLLMALSGFVFLPMPWRALLPVLAAVYLYARYKMRKHALRVVRRRFRNQQVAVLPSMRGLLRWHFVTEGDQRWTVGELRMLPHHLKIHATLDKPEEDARYRALESNVGAFFSDFSPLVHVHHTRVRGRDRYTFTDMRYFIRGDFLHKATLEIEEEKIVTSSFSPFQRAKAWDVPA